MRPLCMQKRLDEYKAWYNQQRVHGEHHSHTPEEKFEGREPKPILNSVRGEVELQIIVIRQSARGGPKLFWLEIKTPAKRIAT